MLHEGYKILIADDSLLNQEALRRLLAPDGPSEYGQLHSQNTIITAKSGPEALEKAAVDKPDLILLDIIMPGMNGFEVLTKLKESDATRPIPVIVISGLSDEEDEEKGFLLGAVDYIVKPFKKSIVMARVNTHLRIVEQMRLIEQVSLLDGLTGIPNRRSLDNSINTEWKRAVRNRTPLSFFMIDVDNFKRYNDTYGHRQGDEALRTVSEVLHSSLQRPADFAARWGGEEFAMLLPNTGLQGALHVAEHVRSNIENTAITSVTDTGDPSVFNITVSIGAASIMPSAENNIVDLIEQADKSLYTAKNTGKNKVCSLVQ